jgi:hypothetical protein
LYAEQALAYQIGLKMYTPYAGDGGILVHTCTCKYYLGQPIGLLNLEITTPYFLFATANVDLMFAN